jgi:hypothetical protein
MKIKYRELKNYKYELMENFVFKININQSDLKEADLNQFPYVYIKNNLLKIMRGYCWDGPSGISFDTKNFMRGSLIHDALYQLMRQGILPESYRKYADELLYKICVEDGMSKPRAWYVLKAVRLFGKSSATAVNENEIQDLILEAP